MISNLNERNRKRNNRTRDVEEDKINNLIYVRPIVDYSHIEDPIGLNEGYNLYEYQKEILSWMEMREASYSSDKPRSMRNGYQGIRGGILMAEMGLGKTLISMVHILRCKQDKPTLVISSKTIMTVWRKENAKLFNNSISILYIHASCMKAKEIKNLSIEKFITYDIVMTTYHMISHLNKKIEYDVGLDTPRKHGVYSYHLTEFEADDTLQKG